MRYLFARFVKYVRLKHEFSLDIRNTQIDIAWGSAFVPINLISWDIAAKGVFCHIYFNRLVFTWHFVDANINIDLFTNLENSSK